MFFAVPMILAARAGSRPVLRASELLPSIASLLAVMATSAAFFGITGYVLAQKGVLATDWLTFSASPGVRYRFMADWCFLRGCFRWRHRSLRDDLSQTTSANS